MNDTARLILEKINSCGFQAYLVGGYPRDLYLGRISTDFDICTNATPKDLKEICGDVKQHLEQYGSVTVYLNDLRFEITTFRKDVKYINNRKPIEIEYIDNLEDDLKRRDFTMNTMCLDSEGNLIDLLNGKEDIDKHLIRTVGDADKKISEDSLRILRAIRFATTLDFSLDPLLKIAIVNNKDLLKTLSYYRKKEELDKIFASANSKYGINLIKELGLSNVLELSNTSKVVSTTYPIGIWAQLDCMDKYDFNKTEKDTIIKINELMDKDILDNNNLYKYGLYISTIVGEIRGIDSKLINEAYNSLYIHNKTEIKIDPKEICTLLDRKPGKYLREIIGDIENKLINKELKNDNEILKNYVLEAYK